MAKNTAASIPKSISIFKGVSIYKVANSKFWYVRVQLTLAAFLLSGCAAQLSFIDRKDGQIYSGTTGGTAGSGGEALVNIGGKDYKGPWIYSANGGGYSVGNFSSNSTATAGAYRATAFSSGSSSALFISAQGNGLINLYSDKGSFIRCVFNFNTLSNTGIGECRRNDGREYDLTLRR